MHAFAIHTARASGPVLSMLLLLALGCGSPGSGDTDGPAATSDSTSASSTTTETSTSTSGATDASSSDTDASGTDTDAPAVGPWKEASFFIELTEDDIEVQSFVDASRWDSISIVGPSGEVVVAASTAGNMGQQGLSEMKIDGHPSHFPILGEHDPEVEQVEDYLAVFPAGTYGFTGTTVGGDNLSGESEFTHDLPALPEIVTPADEDIPEVLDPLNAQIEWMPVTQSYFGAPLDVTAYEVIVEQIEPFRKLSVHLPATETSLTIPPEFLSADAVYDVEVVAIEASANQSISTSQFRTSDTATEPEEPAGPPAGAWKVTTFFIELTEDDIEVQSFVDATRWRQMAITGPSNGTVFEFATSQNMLTQGISELKLDGHPSHFPIENDPENLEVESPEVFLELFPEGVYRFDGMTVGDQALSGQASLTHNLPAIPELTVPADTEEPSELPLDGVVIEWLPVTENYFETGPIDIVAYEIIVELEDPFRKLSIVVPSTATSLTVPPEFLAADSDYVVELIAIEPSDNQSILEREFTTP